MMGRSVFLWVMELEYPGTKEGRLAESHPRPAVSMLREQFPEIRRLG